MSYYQVPGKRLPAIEKKHKTPPAHLHPAEPHVLLHEHAGAAVHEPQGAAGRELRDLAAAGSSGSPAASPTRPRTSCRRAIRLSGRTPSTGTTCARRSASCASRAISGKARLRLEPRRPRRPAVHASTSCTVLDQIGFHATEKIVTAGSYWATIGNQKTRAQIGFADFVQDYPHPLDWFRLLDGRAITQIHNSNYANFDVGWANRRDRGAHPPDGADARGQQRLGCARPEGDAARSVGSVPQPGGDGLLQRPRRPRLLRQQRPLRVRLREHLRQQQISPNCVNKSVFQ